MPHKWTPDARKILTDCWLSRLGISAAQFYPLLGQTSYRKTSDQMLLLLSVLNRSVDVRSASGALVKL
ncbi:MAG: hypothetical protein PHQ23_13715 [Candidatus Wallbacteria bacterium]|nr:hypothetical protein [Candidatus Wallbacteria bacterium]